MENILSIYKFHFPFLDSKYEKTKKDSFISNLKNFFIYEEVFDKMEKKYENKAEFLTIFLKNWKVEIMYYDEIDYFIPIFQIEFFLKEKDDIFKEKLFHKVFNIASTIWRQDYIFNIDESFIPHRNNDIISILDLERNFKKISDRDLKDFFTNIVWKDLELYFEYDFKIKHYFIYLIYLCYNFYYNNKKLESSQNELQNITWNSDFAIYELNIDFVNQRVEYLSDINLVSFKKYYKILNDFFSLIKIF